MKSLGRVRLGTHDGKPAWCVDKLQPHVAIAFKRLFAKYKHRRGALFLSDSDETRADLEWFMQRYPLDTTAMEILREGAVRLDRRQRERNEILSTEWVAGETGGWKPGYAPYFYQEQAAEICARQQFLLLGDDAGLGKTVSAFALANRTQAFPMAITVQPHLVMQWGRRAREFTTLRVHEVKSGKPYHLPPADIYIFSYAMTAGWEEFFDQGYFRSVVWDEIQDLRHGDKTAKGKAARALADHAEYRLGLTATPIYNYGDEMHTVMSYINPDLLGSREEFMREWCSWGKQVKDPDALGSYLEQSGYMLRRLEDDPSVDQSLPPPNIIDVKLDWNQSAVDDEAALMRSLAMKVLDGSFTESGQASRELDVKMRMLTGIAKAKSVAAYVKLLLKDHPRVLVGGWHRDVYEKWLYALHEFNPILYTGTESKAGKQRNLDRFLHGDCRVLLMSLRSGAGIDGIQYGCNQVVFGELDWSPQIHYQMMRRLRRPGQKGIVDAHYLHVDGGSDPIIMQTLGVKSDQSRGILDPNKEMQAKTYDGSRVKALAQSVLEQLGA